MSTSPDLQARARAIVEPYPTLIRGLAITAIVLGALGALLGLWGVVGTLLQSTGGFATQAPPGLPPGMQGAFDDLMTAQKDAAIWSVFPTVLSGLISVFMLIAGIQSVQQRKVGLLAYAALGAALADLIAMVIMPAVVFWLMQDAFTAYFEAVSTIGAGRETEMIGQIASTAMTMGMVFNAVIGLAFVAFWVWAFTVLSRHASLTGETD